MRKRLTKIVAWGIVASGYFLLGVIVFAIAVTIVDIIWHGWPDVLYFPGVLVAIVLYIFTWEWAKETIKSP